ncbi:MAG TPA: hypothetical protein VFS20_09880 [Longimicrobium sp.]|nr:hypothetical protein [Longimicrobium sp.]
MKYTRSLPAAVLAVLATAACDTAELVTPDASVPAAPALAAAPQAQIRTSDDEHARVARAEVPGFAGFYLQEDGTPVVRLVDASQRGAAQRYLAQEFARARRGRHANAPTEPVFLNAAYDFAQLKGWAGQVEGLLTRSDVYLVDVDEVNNRVHVGVADNAAAGAVRSEAARIGIPAAALFVQTQSKPEGRATLRDRLTTIVGGTQIAFGNYVCTLGFNARRVSTGANVYVTNSHCTQRQYRSDGIALYQPTRVASNQIGAEVADRALYACVSGVASCRQADAAYYSNNGTRAVGQGGIARTALATFANAGITIIGEFDIVSRYTGTLPVGTVLEKTGRTSGSTYGQVTQSCVTIGSLRCQDVSRVWSEGGDSGSPMYVNVGGNSVALYGILWGGPSTDWTTTYSSRLSGIEADLGALTNLCRPANGC